MKSQNPNVVGMVACPECGGPCEVRQHKRGQFLYKHCQDRKQCQFHSEGRGAAVQARWRAEIAEDAEFTPIDSPVKPEKSDPVPSDPDEYIPGQSDPVPPDPQPSEKPDKTQSGGGWKTAGMVGLSLVSAFLGYKGVQSWKQR